MQLFNDMTIKIKSCLLILHKDITYMHQNNYNVI